MLVNAPTGVVIARASKSTPGRSLCGRGVFCKNVSGLLPPRGDTKRKSTRLSHTAAPLQQQLTVAGVGYVATQQHGEGASTNRSTDNNSKR